LDARLVQRYARERHVVLPADEAAEPAETGLDRTETATVALAPDQALMVRGHELAVVEGELAGRRVVEERVVDRPRPLWLYLVDAGDDPDPELLRRRSDAPLGRGADCDRLLREAGERLLRTGRLPAGEGLRPERRRIDRNECLWEDDELRAFAGNLGGHLLELVERRLTVEHDRLDLDARDLDWALHAQEPTPAPPEPGRNSQRSTRMGYSSSIASVGVASAFDIATWTPLGPSASGQAPWPPPTVS